MGSRRGLAAPGSETPTLVTPPQGVDCPATGIHARHLPSTDPGPKGPLGPNAMPTFACPFCQERVSVDLDAVGNPVACAACSRPFRPQVPEASLVEETEGQWHAVRPVHGGSADERLIRRVRPAAFRRAPIKSALLFGTAGLALTAAIGVSFRSDDDWLVATTTIVGIIVAVLCILPLALAFIETRFESLTVTSQRSLWRRGIFTKATSEVQHDDIRNIQIKQGLLDPIPKVGTVSISSAGQDDMEIVVTGVPRPQEFVEMVRAYQRRLERTD